MFRAVGLRVLARALLEDYICLCLLKQSFYKPSLPSVLCIEHVKTLCCDLVIILIIKIEWFLCSLPVLWLCGWLAFVLKIAEGMCD
jgi:hypothetical protein